MNLPLVRFVVATLALAVSTTESHAGQADNDRTRPSRPSLAAKRLAPPKEVTLTQRIRFERLSMESGLSHSVVYTVHEDRRGFVWFGTADGLNRFDGYQMTVFRHDPLDPESLGGGAVERIFEDDEGTLWLAHAPTGVTRFDPVTESVKRYRHDPNDPNSLAGDIVLNIFQDARGHIWFSGPPELGGLTYRAPDADRFTRVEITRQPADDAYRGGVIWDALELDEQHMLLAANFLVEELDLDTGRFTHYFPPRPERRLSAITRDESGNIWAAGFHGIYRVDRDAKRLILMDLPVTRISAMAADAHGQFWVGTGQGLYVVNDEMTRVIHHYTHDARDPTTIPAERISSLEWTRSGLLWMTSRQGVGAFHPARDRFVSFRLPWDGSIAAPVRRSISGAVDGSIWMTDGKGVARVDLESRTADVFDLGAKLNNRGNAPPMNVIYAGSNETVWFAGGERLYRLETTTRELRTFEIGRHALSPGGGPAPPGRGPPTDVLDIVEDSDGIIWVAAVRGGLFFGDGASSRLDPFRAMTNELPDSLHDATTTTLGRSGTLWVGTEVGKLFGIDPKERVVSRRFVPNDHPNLPAAKINTVHEDQNGDVWLGTQLGVVHVDLADNNVKLYGRAPGLESRDVESILEDDDGRLWLGTRSGIVRFDPRSEQFRRYDTDDGLPNDAVVAGASRSQTGHLMFADSGGLTLFQPRTLDGSDYNAPVLLTSFQLMYETQRPHPGSVLERSIWDTSALELDHHQNAFGFEFAALDYESPRKNRYRYRLDGFDAAWREVDSTHRVATYTHVPPGRYTFRVEREADVGRWQSDGASIQLTVKRPWWMTWWARGGALLGVLGVVFGWHRARIGRVRATNVLLEDEVARRTAALEDANRRLELAATTDPLTGVPNRRHYIERAELELAKLRRSRRAFTIALADIDDFKQVNDAFGHEFGDRILKRVAGVLQAQVRELDVVARWGGEEFILLLPETDASGATIVANKILEAIAADGLETDGQRVRVTLTIGVAEVSRNETLEESTARADRALYAGKRQGKNCVVSDPSKSGATVPAT